MFGQLISNLKSRMTMIIMNNCDDNRFFLSFVGMGFKTRVFIHESAEHYDERRISRARIVECCLWHIFTIITWIRAILPVIVPKRWVIGLVSSPATAVFATNIAVDDINMRMAHFTYGQGPFILFILLLILQTTELNYTNTCYKFGIDYMKKRLLPLSSRNARKLIIRSNMVLILFKVTFIPILLLTITGITALNIQSYLNNDFHFTLTSIIFFNFSLIFFIIQLFGYFSLSVTICVFFVLYLRYKFREINNRFLLCLRFKNFSHLQIIAEHNQICKLTHDINQLVKLFLFVLYYLVSPTYMTAIKLGEHAHLTLIAKFGNTILIGVLFGGTFTTNLMSSLISKASTLPLKYLHRYMAENNLPLNQRLKTMEMIERLCGPDIGFYCYDLFPMNSYEFYKFVANCFLNYILIKTLW